MSERLDGFGLNLTAYKAGQGFYALLRAGRSRIDSPLIPRMFAFGVITASVALAISVFVLVVKERQRGLGSEHLAAMRANGSTRMSLLRAGGRNVILLYGGVIKLGLGFCIVITALRAGVGNFALALAIGLSNNCGNVIVTNSLFEKNTAMDAGIIDGAVRGLIRREMSRGFCKYFSAAHTVVILGAGCAALSIIIVTELVLDKCRTSRAKHGICAGGSVSIGIVPHLFFLYVVANNAIFALHAISFFYVEGVSGCRREHLLTR